MLWILEQKAWRRSNVKGFIVRAESKATARKVASMADDDERSWLDDKQTSCEQLAVGGNGENEVVMSQF